MATVVIILPIINSSNFVQFKQKKENCDKNFKDHHIRMFNVTIVRAPKFKHITPILKLSSLA